ncbi:AAA domain-containing protein [Heyndrickxia sporothermodurans]|uniref:DEAD/DEAH box helicase n=1 Tax=Heyndrickxia sporothermodurans TaxID=46224 RepID=UPI002DBCE138|nr:AAA domain-containing protein [Heyndrickxia sporothermodurans]MEB6550013.1 AAA domain-containing protein [Heyndrickxia sporothermodurans]MED3782268.1 AAA domain-containing protein [Heyndrickxia sporothermodurans]
MTINTKLLIKEWQHALQLEIQHLKKYGSTKYHVSNGFLVSNDSSYTYYFETAVSLKIPIGASVRLEWEKNKYNGRILSSEGKNMIISFDKYIGDLISTAFLYHDPWELLEQLINRLDEAKKNKRKRISIKQLMDPGSQVKHPTNKIKSNIHELVLRSKYNPVTFVWGPPGTGKTYTLARVAANKYFKEKRVLILSHSNKAVDVLMNEVLSFVQQKNRFVEGDVIRFGMGGDLREENQLSMMHLLEKREPALFEKKQQFSIQKKEIKKDLGNSFSNRDTDKLLEVEGKLAKILETIRRKEVEYVKEARIIGTTLAKAAGDPTIYEQEYDLIIIDEASMAYIPQIAFAATLAKRVIVCGDFKQLPPIASSRHSLVNKWLREDIFHKANVVYTNNEDQLHPHLFLLKEQRRMHPDISAFTNRYIYQSLVGDHEKIGEMRKSIARNFPFPNRASILLDTSFSGSYCISERISTSKINPFHLLLSFQLIHESLVSGISSIGFVTPYRAQATLMDQLLMDLYPSETLNGDIVSATVHRFQGSEKDLVIFDTVDGSPQTRPSMLLSGSESERLINVAMTRAKGKFIHIANKDFIHQHVFHNKTIRQLVEHQDRLGQTVSLNDIGKWVRHSHPKLKWVYARKLDQVFIDIHTAQDNIILSLPEHATLSKQWEDVLNNRAKKVKLLIISTKEWKTIKPNEQIKDHLPFPYVIIDQNIFWSGLPLEGMINIKPPYITARLESDAFVNYFIKQLPINRII